MGAGALDEPGIVIEKRVEFCGQRFDFARQGGVEAFGAAKPDRRQTFAETAQRYQSKAHLEKDRGNQGRRSLARRVGFTLRSVALVLHCGIDYWEPNSATSKTPPPKKNR